MTETSPLTLGPFHVVDDSGRSDGAWLYVAPDVYGLTVYTWRREPGDPPEVSTADASLHVDVFDNRVRAQVWDALAPHDDDPSDVVDLIATLTNEPHDADGEEET